MRVLMHFGSRGDGSSDQFGRETEKENLGGATDLVTTDLEELGTPEMSFKTDK